MGLVELTAAMMILAMLVGITVSAATAIKRYVEEHGAVNNPKEEQGTEGTAPNLEDKVTSSIDELFGETEYEEIVEVPAPGPAEEVKVDIAPIMCTLVSVACLIAMFATRRRPKKAAQPVSNYSDIAVAKVLTTTAQAEFNGSVEGYLVHLRELLGNRMSKSDAEEFHKVEVCAVVFDSMELHGGDTLGRIEKIYLPVVKANVDRILSAPSKTIAAGLMPYLHRSMHVLKEAMEYEICEYQKRAVQEAEAEVSSLEQFAKMKNDTDDFDSVALHL